MPGTMYTSTGPRNDPIGKLADFARFAQAEFEDLLHEMEGLTEDKPTPLTTNSVRHILIELRPLVALLEGFTTADDQ